MKKKVLFVATIIGHIRIFHLPFLKLFKDMGYETYVVAKCSKEDDFHLDYVDHVINISIERNPLRLNNLKAIKELKGIINKENFDIIHCHTPMGSVVTRVAAKKARKNGTRVIYTAHGFHFFKGAPLKNWLLYYPVEWYLAKYTDTLITINSEDFEIAKNRFNKRCKDIRYVPGVGIDKNKFNFEMNYEEKLELINSLNLKKDDFILTCIARLDKNKNQGFLIEVMKLLVAKNQNIHLLLAGKDELNGYYQNIVKENELENNIHFLGKRDDVPQLLKISNVVVSASKREGLPVNVLEALAAGLPVVALECRGMKDLIENGKNGYVVNSLKEFYNSIMKLVENKNLREKMGKISNQNVEKYKIENVLKEMCRIYGNDI